MHIFNGLFRMHQLTVTHITCCALMMACRPAAPSASFVEQINLQFASWCCYWQMDY